MTKPRAAEGKLAHGSFHLEFDPLVQVEDLHKVFRGRASADQISAVSGVSFSIRHGESLGLVGESGSGKTTVGRCLLRLTDPTEGVIRFGGANITRVSGRALREFRRHMQMVFQDPYDSLNPRLTVRQTLEEPLQSVGVLSRRGRRSRIDELLSLVRLDTRFLPRYPHELSGGQQQRVGIARALATEPTLLVLDEPTSALDWLIRREILELLSSLRETLGLTYLFISHDLSSVQSTCETVAVMYLGRLVEYGPVESLFRRPEHPYTRALLSAMLEPRVDGSRRRIRLHGDPPSSINVPGGCPLHPRCPIAGPACASTAQKLALVGDDHWVACMRLTSDEVVEWPKEFESQRTRAKGVGT